MGDHRNNRNTLMYDARKFYATRSDHKKMQAELNKALAGNPDETTQHDLNQHLKELDSKAESGRLERLERVDQLSDKLLDLVEGESEQETLLNTAKCLGTMLLITEGPVGNFAQRHQAFKPLYKAVLSLRLTDSIVYGSKLKHSYLSRYTDSQTRFTGNRHWQVKWREEIAKPLIRAALFQDIGLQHPHAQHILVGENGEKDPFRVLNEEERKALLKLNYQHTLEYIQYGLGSFCYKGNCKTERQEFLQVQEDAQTFCAEVINDAFITKNNIGELIKVPQIYASFIFSTKPDYTRKDLPKGYMIIEQLAKAGKLNKRMAENFLSIVGYFPQGFGISYIPRDSAGVARNTFEYAIVNRLCPEQAAEPLCRTATRSHAFIRSGKNITVPRGDNLFFNANHKKIRHTDEKRIAEIRRQLNANHTDGDDEEVIPSFWEPFTFFSERQHQGLWTKEQP